MKRWGISWRSASQALARPDAQGLKGRGRDPETERVCTDTSTWCGHTLCCTQFSSQPRMRQHALPLITSSFCSAQRGARGNKLRRCHFGDGLVQPAGEPNQGFRGLNVRGAEVRWQKSAVSLCSPAHTTASE